MVGGAWLGRRGPNQRLLIACMPKSGSTYLACLLSAATGFPLRHAVVDFRHRDQDICERAWRRLPRGAVIQQHVKGTDHNVELIRKYQVRPIVLVRNIFDVVVSLDDHLLQEDSRVPTGFVHREYPSLDFDERIEYLIRVHLPWYFNFHMSWREAAPSLDLLPLSYERLFADVRQTLLDILRFYELPADHVLIQRSLDAVRWTNTRLNKGIRGRGQRLLSETHKAAIHELARVWQIGLDEMDCLGLGDHKRAPVAA